MLWRVWDDVRQGAEHFPLKAGVPTGRLSQFAQGLSLPFHVVRALLVHPETRGHYLRVALTQAAFVLGLALLLLSFKGGMAKHVGEGIADRVEEHQAARAEREAARAEREAARGLRLALDVTRRLPGVDENPEMREELQRELREHAARVEERARAAEERARDAEERAGVTVEQPLPRRSVAYWFGYLGVLLSSLQIGQWIVTALSRDYHTALSREASLLTGVPPEDEPLTPRVRLNPGWLWTKIKRHWRGTVVFMLGAPVLWGCSRLLPMSGVVYTLLLSVWGAWWFMVFSAGKSALAWKEEQARAPWFLRGWAGLFRRVPLLGWYGDFWTRHTASVFSPAARVERQPWRFAGLAVARAFAVLPLVKCFLRPAIPVASAHLLTAEPRAEREDAEETSSAPRIQGA